MKEFLIKYADLFIGIIILLYIFQILLSGVKGNKSKKVLSIYLFAFFLFYLLNFSYNSGIIFWEPTATVTASLNLIYYPFLYIYLCSLTEINYSFKSKHILYFAPFIIFTLIFTYFLFQFYSEGINHLLYKNAIRIDLIKRITFFHKVSIYVNLVQFILYVMLMFLRLKAHRKKLKEYFSYNENVSLRWFTNFLIFLIIFWFTDNLNDIFILSKYRLEQIPVLIGLVKFILNILYVSILGIYGLNQAVIFKREDIYLKIRDSEEAEKDNIFETSKEGENKIGEEGGVKKEPFKLSLEQRIKLMERIDKMMVEKKSYRNPQLSIYDIAEEMFTNIKYISLTINSIKKMNFYAYISSYRINEAIELFKTKPELSIPEIMEESGFYSRSSFNEYFHKKTGLSPSEFRKKAQIPGNQQNIII